MSIFSLILKEISRRKAGFALVCGAVALAAAGVVFAVTVNRAYEDATRRNTLLTGPNLLVLPQQADAVAFWRGESGTLEMDEGLVKKLAASNVSADHYVGKLQMRTKINGKEILLTGVMREIGAVGKKKKKPMGWDVLPDECYLGWYAAKRLGDAARVDATLNIMGRKFRVARLLESTSFVEDERVFVNLKDAQEMLGKSGRIHAMDAIGCLCPIDEFGKHYLSDIERAIEKSLNEGSGAAVEAYTCRSMAEVRVNTRIGGKIVGIMTASGLMVMAVLVMLFYMLGDVRARREELGMFLAVGFGPGKLVAMFLTKLVLVALVGAVLGFAVGSAGAKYIDPGYYAKVNIKPRILWDTAVWAIVGALAVSLVAGIIPTLLAVRTDPAEVLRKN